MGDVGKNEYQTEILLSFYTNRGEFYNFINVLHRVR